MPHRLLVALSAALLFVGCTNVEEPAVEPAPAAEAASAAPSGSPGDAVDPAAAAPRILPILFEGSTATQAFVCAAAAPSCVHQDVVAGTSDLFMEGVVGRVAGGSLTLTWDASTPATEELAFGIMLMYGEGEACAPVDLGSLRGASPLSIEVDAAERAVCPGEAVHLWASNGIYVGEDPAYAQLDVDQPFRMEGSVAFEP